MAGPTPLEIAMQQRAAQQNRVLENPGALGRGFAALPGSIYNYATNTSLPDMGRGALSMGKAIGSSMLEDPGAFASDAIFAPWAALRDVSEMRAEARKYRAMGDNETADKMEQYAAVSAIGGLPFAGALVKRGVGAVAKKALPLAVKPAEVAAKKAPLAVERAAQPYLAPGSPERAANLARLMEGAHPEAFSESGLPKDFYHGTADNIYEFDLNHPNRHDAGWLGRGAYLWDKPKTAGDYAELKAGREYPNVLPLHASFKNPYFATLKDKQRLMLIEHAEGKEAASEASRAWTDELMGKGHDSVILKEAGIGWRDAPNEYVVFDPARVKSRFNRGTFDPSEPEINKARGGRVSSLAVKRKGKK